MKMSECLSLPVSVHGLEIGDSYEDYVCEIADDVNGDIIVSAINNHDELIAFVEMVRDTKCTSNVDLPGEAFKLLGRIGGGDNPVNYPMQPIINGRFEANPIVDWLCTEVSNMNDISIYAQTNNIDAKYQEQIAQLVGYSVSGYGDLSYVTDESYERASRGNN